MTILRRANARSMRKKEMEYLEGMTDAFRPPRPRGVDRRVLLTPRGRGG